MKIIVCIKQVPDTNEVRLDPTTGTLIRDGVPSIINPDDKSGLEAALRLKEQHGAHVTVITMGPPQADLALREAIAMGADRAILLTDRAFAGADTWATSSALAGAIQKIDYDLIVTGRQAIDGDTAQVGPQIAEHLKLASVAYVQQIEATEGGLILNRAFEDGYHRIKVKFPCLITALKELAEPRYMRVSGIYDAFKEREVEVWGVDDIIVDRSNLGLKGSPTKVKKSFTKGAKTAGKLFDGTPTEAAQVIVEKLREKFII
ncbi:MULTISPECIES: electron transfer flavoprotein subunit beta/FixA family protein [unclassified Fusibacter]|uniref:electron transfer flavoprotein subunit beta/FixA family protein n=1 Tax=unclassified Fusibacter TaxID=2624464 RepID=UPI0010101F7A|nr:MULTISPECIES: electron transfer flavoprotein subunit beta/FixA family protein [unclassified Fusibacter]MCK8058665.1 electron transfer flavoprotein subunit beta/FixA family protein [Fusibacter sp. A2]NPE21740.1 electron transfer flavoprotein subunit beta/FixA family protein [Fusibacter sp. A1]RXV61314.1 electron transfer flavoprotein subunit beta/FixA family protein [Fusibacter sp. A1]